MPYLREVKVCSVLDHVEEVFSDALDLLTNGCFIYGGAVRDILANFPIAGDLDVAIPSSDLNKTLNLFSESPRWVSGEDEHEIMGSISEAIETNNDYKSSAIIGLVSSIRTFVNSDNRVIQFMEIPPNTENPKKHSVFDNIMALVQVVDITCCGLISDIYGNVYEVIPGAVRDCKERVLRFNEGTKMNERSIEKTKKRVEKLVARGWKNEISFSRLEQLIKQEA